MEKGGGHSMVTGNLAYKLQTKEVEIPNPLAPDPLKYTSVGLSEVLSNNTRLEASAFNLDAKAAKYRVEHCRYGYVHLWGENGLVKEASYPGRFKRIYTEKGKGIPFYLPSQLGEINPRPTKYISESTYKSIQGIEIKPNAFLLSRSGTIGKCSISSRTTIGKVYSDDVIRVFFNSSYDLGYVYAFFCTPIGQQLLQNNNYGAVIQHIEPEHLKNIIIPDAPDLIKKKIHDLVIESYDLRDQSNELMDEAEQILYQELNLPPIEDLKPKYFDEHVDLRNYTTKLSRLVLRLDCSYHTPICNSILELLNENADSVVHCGDTNITKDILLPTRFKRTYVDAKHGIKLIGGKQINELNPSTEKYLAHSSLDDELKLKANSVLITRSGTIGKTAIVPKHWEDWIGSDHIIRIIPANNDIAGYLYCWLSTEYAQQLVKRNTFGAVVDEIDTNQLSHVEIPLLKNVAKQKEINDKVLQANELRYRAYLKEQEAVGMMEEVINE